MQQYLVAREHRKEKRAQKDRAGNLIAEAVGADAAEEGKGLPERGNLVSYCSLDYQRMFDMARWRLLKMRQSLKAELEDRYGCHLTPPPPPYFLGCTQFAAFIPPKRCIHLHAFHVV